MRTNSAGEYFCIWTNESEIIDRGRWDELWYFPSEVNSDDPHQLHKLNKNQIEQMRANISLSETISRNWFLK